MGSWPHLEKIARERKAAKAWIESLDRSTLGLFIDALVLGDYDWRDFFTAKPSRAFIDEAFTHGQYLEDTRD